MNKTYLLFMTCAVSGCSSISGIGGSSSLACPLPEENNCRSIVETYKGARPPVAATSTPKQFDYEDGNKPAPAVPERTVSYVAKAEATQAVRDTPATGMPLRTAPRVLRVWIAPYEDENGTLRDQSYAYVVVDQGKWQIEHNQKKIMDQYAPVRASNGTPTPATTQESIPNKSGGLSQQEIRKMIGVVPGLAADSNTSLGN
jgi:conjugal transfer pilus assembly protein TraV